jgi:galactosamine-6-phosphate isomerase
MQIEYFSDYQAMSEHACDLMLQQIEENLTLYSVLRQEIHRSKRINYSHKNFRKDQQSFVCLCWMNGMVWTKHRREVAMLLQKYLVEPLQIPNERFFIYDSQTSNPEEACLRMQVCLKQEGPIDLVILGIGLNGHLGFNEPNDFLSPACHVAELEEQTKQHTMIGELSVKPTKGLTLGMGEILQAKKIILLINGAHKKEITKAFLKGEISTHLPASFLWLHPNVTCLIEANAL